MKLTARQRDVFDFIQSRLAQTGEAPSRTQIAHRFDMWPNQAQEIVSALRRKGFITVEPGKRRGIELAAP